MDIYQIIRLNKLRQSKTNLILGKKNPAVCGISALCASLLEKVFLSVVDCAVFCADCRVFGKRLYDIGD